MRIEKILLLLLTCFCTTYVYALERDASEHYYCPKHIFAEGTFRELANCPEEQIGQARPFFELIPRPYEATECVCGQCGTLMFDEGFCEGSSSYEYYDPETESWEEEEILEWYEPEEFYCPNDCLDAEGLPDAQPCKGGAWYFGYFDKSTDKYYPYFIEHLKYCSENPLCNHLWPELGGLAAEINDIAYRVFARSPKKNLVNEGFHKYFLQLNNHGKTSSLVTYLYFYSQYHRVFCDLIRWTDFGSVLPERTQIQIDRLYAALDEIQPLFLNLYSECIANHPHPKLFYERGLVYFHQGDHEEAGYDIQHCLNTAGEEGLDDILLSELYHHQGELYLNARAYDQAIAYMTQSIIKNPSRKEYHLSRAAAYLELGEFDLALADFYDSGFKKSWAPDNAIQGDAIKAAPAFAKGVLAGAKESLSEFIPSLMATGRGIAKATWAAYSFPGNETYMAETVETIESIVEYVRENCDVGGLTLIPEFRELIRANPDDLTHEVVAYKVGHMMGKYGTDILTVAGISKLFAYSHKLKQINTLATLEACASSSATMDKIAASTAEHAVKRAETLKTANPRINPNKQAKHIRGHPYCTEEKSIFEWGDPEAFVKRYQGQGVPGGNKIPGMAGYRETIDAGEVIGLHYDKQAKQFFPTTRATIHYAQEGCHIVPSQPIELLHSIK